MKIILITTIALPLIAIFSVKLVFMMISNWVGEDKIEYDKEDDSIYKDLTD